MKIEDAVKQKEFKSSQEKAWINLVYTYNRSMDRIQQVLKQFDITHQQYNMLRILRGRKGDVASCGEVKEVMLDKSPDITRLSDRLIDKGLIERGTNPDNRREVQLSITKKGLELLERVDPELEKNSGFLFNLSDNEAQMLSDLLEKMRQ